MSDQQSGRRVPPPPPPTVLGYSGPPQMVPGGTVPCPRCQSYATKAVNFTWWGGLVGPRMFSHTKCQACKFGFNRKTGKSNDMAIAIYVGVAFAVIALVAVVGILR